MPGPGRGAARQQATAGGTLPDGIGARSALPTTSGIPTASTASGSDSLGAGLAGQQQAVAVRRRRRGAGNEPAVGSGRLGLTAYLSTRAPREGSAIPGTAAAPAEPASGSGEEASQQPLGRRWKAAQQQQLEQQRDPLARLLRRTPTAAAGAAQQDQAQPRLSQQALQDATGGSCAQPARLGPSRFAPDAACDATTAAAAAVVPAAALAPAIQTTQLAASQGQELPWEQVLGAVQEQGQQAGDAAPGGFATGAPPPSQQQQQPQAGAPAVPGDGIQPLAPQRPGQAPAEQASLQLPGGAETAGTALTFATSTAALGPGATQWTLPPTPSAIRALSADSPATAIAVGRAAELPAAARQGGSAGGTHAGGGGVCQQPASGVPPSAAPPPRSQAPMPASAAAGGTALALRRRPELSCAAETPQLLFASPAGQPVLAAQQRSTDGEARQLFVAETPSDTFVVAARRTGRGASLQEPPLRLADGAAAAMAAALAQEAAAAAAAAAATPAAAAVAGPGAAAGVTPAHAAVPVAGLQLQLPLPVLQAVPCNDGRHVALLLGSYAPAGEPEHVLVLRLPADPATLLAAGCRAAGGVSAHSRGDCGDGSCCGVRVVAALPVERSKWGQGVRLAPNCLQLAATER